jgi:hypothetical protein
MDAVMKRYFNILTFLFALLAAAQPARAQFVGYTSPQTVTATPLLNANCAGAVASTPSAIPNLGQSFHYISYLITNAGGALPFETRVSLQGSYDGGIFFAISDIAMDASSVGGQLVGYGQFPIFRVTVGCLGGSGVNTVTVNYSGTSVSSSIQFSDFDRTIYKKPIIFGASQGSNRSTNTITTPYGSSAGVLACQALTAGFPAGSTVDLLQLSDSFVSAYTIAGPFTLAATITPQLFPLNGVPSAALQLNYTSGGASANNYNCEIYFFKPGATVVDPCGPQNLKSSAVVTAGAAATTQQIALVANKSIYVCGYQISQVATAGTLQWVFGTGANCVTGTTNLTGAMGVTASQPIAYSGTGLIFRTPIGQALCLTTTGAGGTAAGVVTFIQQ